MDFLWSQIEQTRHDASNLPAADPGMAVLKLLSSSYDQTAFTWFSDIRETEATKAIHMAGSTAKIRWLIFPDPSNPYTGVFKAGYSENGLIRISIAKKLGQDGDNFTPGAGIKLLHDGEVSDNFLVMFQLNGQGTDHCPFSHSFSNKLDQPEFSKSWVQGMMEKAVFKQFAKAVEGLSSHPSLKPVSALFLPSFEAASYQTDSKLVVAPYSIELVPQAFLKTQGPSSADFRDGLAKIPGDTVIYSIRAKQSESAESVEMGEIVLNSEFVSSEFGDKKLFFRHPAISGPVQK